MDSKDLDILKKQIEELRYELNILMKYPEIFEEEVTMCSNKIDRLINKYMIYSKKKFTKT